MPSPEENVLSALKAKKDDEIVQIIQEHPALINLVTPNSKSSLMYMMLFGNKPKELVEFFVTHPGFNFQFVNRNGYSNLDVLFQYGRVDVMPAVLQKPELLLIDGKPTYVRATELLAEAELNMAENKKVLANAKFVEKDAVKIANLKQMIVMLYEPTVKLAIAKDDPSILAQMEVAGANLRKELSTGERPFQSLNDANVKLDKWFDDYNTRTREVDDSAVQQMYAFFAAGRKLQELEGKKQEALLKILDEATDGHVKRMDAVEQAIIKSGLKP